MFAACALLFSTIITFADEPKSRESELVVTKLKYFPIFPWFNDSWNTKRLSPDNPDKHLVDADVASLTAGYIKSGFAKAVVAEPVQLQTGVLGRLFPNHRFYLIGWDEQPVKGKKVIGLGLGLYYNFIIGTSNEITKLSGSGNFDEYGQFLSKNNIKIKSSEDARSVWLAFCDIHQQPWHSRDLKQVSTTEWHLGLYQTDVPFRKEQFYFWYQIILGSDQKVTSAKLMSEAVLKSVEFGR